MTKPNLIVKVIGGAHSGKSALANAIFKFLRKNAIYSSKLQDGEVATAFEGGPVAVLVQTQFEDAMLAPVLPDDSRPVTLADLKAAFLVWELQRRAGKLKSDADVSALPAGQVAEGAATHLWDLLNAVQS